MSRSSNDRNWALIGGTIMLFLVLFMLVSYVWMPFLMWGEQREAGEEVVEDQMDAEQAIQEYRWFRQQYHDIQAQRNQINNSYEEHEQFHETYGDDPNEWSRTAENRHGRIHTRMTGYQNQLEDMVADYNARSDDATRSVFKCHLPYKVDERFAISGPPGSGAPEQPQDEYVDGADPGEEPPEPEECDSLPEKESTN